MRHLIDHGFVLLQRILPKRLLTAIVHSLSHIRTLAVKDFLIRQFVRSFNVDLQDIARPVPDGFDDFNDFFTRELASNTRPVDADPHSVVSPVDGTISASGQIVGNTIFQAKGLHYTLADLLATDLQRAAQFENGSFATIYLAPYNYHRIHSPLAGKLIAANYVPGDLFSVNNATVSLLPNLFARNERVICHFETAAGRMVLVLVGALNVGSISTVWSGKIRPRTAGPVQQIDLRRSTVSTAITKGGLVGWFNMGSTVILLMPPGACRWQGRIKYGQEVRMGESIASIITQGSP
jgi:phosphatidylserine decarboxylase